VDEERVKKRLHDALHRGHRKVTAVVLAVVGEVAVELSVLLADLSQRVTALEARQDDRS